MPLKRLRARLASDGGFTMLTVTVAMTTLAMIALAAWQSGITGISVARQDQDSRRAYEVAQAGIQWYREHLQVSADYWTKCTNVPVVAPGQPAPVNQEWGGTGADPRQWMNLPGSTTSKFTVELLQPRDNGVKRGTCDQTNPEGSLLKDGVLQIRSTGVANGHAKSVVATLRRHGFLDYVYFTQWEVGDPYQGGASNPDTACDKKRSLRSEGNLFSGRCTIDFHQNETFAGSAHTNDESMVGCNTLTFGRAGKGDTIEINGATNPVVPLPGICSSVTPTYNALKSFPGGTVQMPQTNTTMQADAQPNWDFAGDTCLKFNGDYVDVYPSQNWAASNLVTCTGTPDHRPLTGVGSPPHGVIYVHTDTSGAACPGLYKKWISYDSPSSCGDVAVSGTYNQSVSIAAQNDIIITADLKHTGNAMMGLIANNYVRSYHPVNRTADFNCTNAVPAASLPHLFDTTILALHHAFVLDNEDCGGDLGTKTVTGAIAQYYAGSFGVYGSYLLGGYNTEINAYDDRLKVRNPPDFLVPANTSWDIIQQAEQKPAAY
jgi:type II secretory pathway pseudopilin PulG